MSEVHRAAFQIIDDVIAQFGLDDHPPKSLYHYTSLDAAKAIIDSDNLHVTHSEFLNDASEKTLAQETVLEEISRKRLKSKQRLEIEFLDKVEVEFRSRTLNYEAFVFSLSEGDPNRNTGSQDVLSFWRAYGRNGKGVCLTFDGPFFRSLSNQGASRINRIVYDDYVKEKIIEKILHDGFGIEQTYTGGQGVKSCVTTLLFIIPMFKHYSFSEEREWRYIYFPDLHDASTSKRKFYVRDDLIIPYYNFKDIHASNNLVLPIKEIMIGPSRHQDLNLRAAQYFFSQNRIVSYSKIPYRT